MIYHPDPVRREKVIEQIIAEVKMPPRDRPTDSVRRFRRPDQRQFVSIHRRTGRAFDKLAQRLGAGKITLDEFREALLATLEDGHVLASAVGRRRAGDPATMTALDSLRATIVMRDERRYFEAFVQQIVARDPRYVDDKGNLDPGAIASRSRAYLGKLRGTANDAFVGSSDPGDLFDWVMLATEHCAVCPERQANSPYTKATLPSHPGDGATPCRQNCGCVLVRYDGVVGFARPGDRQPPARWDLSLPSDEEQPDTIPIIDIAPDDPRLQDWFVV